MSIIRLVAFVLLVSACSADSLWSAEASVAPLGGACEVLPYSHPLGPLAIQSPAFACESRMCLANDLGAPNPTPVDGVCTDACETNADCASMGTAGGCAGGYTCQIATTVGPFCCQPVCVCRDDVIEGPESLIPYACDPANPETNCANLSI